MEAFFRVSKTGNTRIRCIFIIKTGISGDGSR